MSTVKTDNVIGSFLPIPVIEHATDSEVYTATAGQTVFITTKFDRSNAIRAIAKSSGGAFSEVTASWTGVNTVTISGTILGAGQVFYIFKVGTHASMIRVQDATGAWVDLSSFTVAKAGANSDITSLTGLTTALSVSQGGTGATTADAARASLGVAGRNRIINGDCRVAQRGSGVYTTGISTYSGPDRFFASNSSSGGQFTQSLGAFADGIINRNSVIQTVNTIVPDLSTNKFWSGITQTIEGANCFDLLGQPVTVSFLFKASVAGTYSVALRDSTGSYSYVTTFNVTSNVVTKVIVNVPAIPSAAVVPSTTGAGLSVYIGAINSATLSTSTLNAWQNASYICASTSTLWGLTAGATISVTDLQLEAGTAATPFERRSYGHELALCKRYTQIITQDQAYYASVSGMPWYTSVPLSVEMRALPTQLLISAGSLVNISAAVLTPLSAWSVSIGITISAIGNGSCGQRVYMLTAEL